MKRMPAFLDNCTSTFPRTTRCTGWAGTVYRTPLWKRTLWFFCRHGWLLVVAILAYAVYQQVTAGRAEAHAAKVDQAAQRTCPPGHVAVMLDGSTSQCFVELGSPIASRP